MHGRSSAVFIGSTALLVGCAELFQMAGHTIRYVISSDPLIQRWAAANGLPLATAASGAAVQAVLEEQPFDYLFSVANDRILRPAALRTPRKLALNYHDGPLPRYAGVHATSWAILHGEATHGITWHEMAVQVDAGRIAKQRLLDITSTDTAATLNARCFDAALEAFRELLADLDAGQLTMTEQDLHARTYFASYQRPRAAALLDWQQPAACLDRLVRALTFGPTANPLGLPKAFVEGVLVLVSRLDILNDRPSSATPGTVLAIHDDGIEVATASCDVLLPELRSVDGRLFGPSDLADLGLRPGRVLPGVDPLSVDALTAAYEVTGRHEAFWVDRLATLDARPLPYETPESPADQSPRWIETNWPAPSAGDADADGVLATTAAFLLRLCGGATLDVAYADDGMHVPSLNGLVGEYVPLRIVGEPNRAVSDALRSVRDDLLNVRRRGRYARDIVVRWPRLAGVAAGAGGQAMPIALECRARDGQPGAAPSGCHIRFVVRPDGSAARCVYDADVVDQDVVDRLCQQFGVFARAAADTARPLSELSLLTDDERHRLLVEWNATGATLVGGRMDDLVRRQAERTPDAIAIVWQDRRLTYGELQAQADLLALDLRARGVGPNTIVGVYLERSPELIVAILGVLGAGGAYVPLDPGHPSDRLGSVLADAHVRVVVCDAVCAEKLPPDLGLDRVSFGHRVPIRSGAPQQPEPPADASPDDLAYVIYTSGSTGAPKGVAVSHASLVQSTHARSLVYERPVERFVLLSSVAFDSSVAGIFWTLCSGGTLLLPEQGAERDPAIIADMIVQQRASHLLCLPTLWRLVLDQLATALSAHLVAVVVAGEACPPGLVARHAAVLPATQLFNEYGPTEATVWATVHRCSPEDGDRTVPIGRPIPNTRVYVLDASRQPVPVGVPGELYIGGAGLARGYLGQPALTAERFVADPFTTSGEARLYRTGDLVRHRPDGTLAYLGRLDQQIKVRGVRVEPSEVEAVLERHPDVARAVVMLVQADSSLATGHAILVAYIQARSGAQVGESELQDLTRRALPGEMVPSACVFVDELPLTPNGKLDRDALLRLGAARVTLRQTRADYTAPRDGLEWELARLWERTLGIRPIGAHDSFFDLGGDSLVAAELFAQIQQRFDCRLPLASLVRGPTVADMARLLREGDSSRLPWSPLVPLRESGTQTPLFCMHSEGGNVLEYRPLARFLGDDRPVYGLQARGLDGRDIGQLSIEEMATEYLRFIRLVQPRGPYFLSGYCLGGILALEIARQLQAEGHEVGLVALIQTTTVDYSRPRDGGPVLVQALRRGLARADREVAGLRLVQPQFRPAYTAARIGVLSQVARTRLEGLGGRLPFRRTRRQAVHSHAFAMAALASAHVAAYERYVPRPYNGRVVVFRASKQPWGIVEDPSLGWRDLVQGELDLYEVPGFHHYVLREPAVRMIAERLSAALGQLSPSTP